VDGKADTLQRDETPELLADVAELDAPEQGSTQSARVQAVVTLAAPMTTSCPAPISSANLSLASVTCQER
jgi:hypothetical protein